MKKLLSILLLLCFILPCPLFLEACNEPKSKVVFMVDNEEYAHFDTDGNETIDLPINPTKDGYLFDGWYLNDNSAFDNKAYRHKKISEDITVYAKWIKLYTISTSCNDGANIYLLNTNNSNKVVANTVVEFIIKPPTVANQGVEYYTYMLLNLTVSNSTMPIEYSTEENYTYDNWQFTKYIFTMPSDDVTINASIILMN